MQTETLDGVVKTSRITEIILYMDPDDDTQIRDVLVRTQTEHKDADGNVIATGRPKDRAAPKWIEDLVVAHEKARGVTQTKTLKSNGR